MDAPNLAAVLDAFRSGGRCETALLERFGSALACPDVSHSAFWAAQRPSSSPDHLLRFEREGAAWLEAFPVLVTASCRLHGPQGAVVRRLAEALVATQEAHCVGVALRCLEVTLRALPAEELDGDWRRLLRSLFGLKASLQSDINLPHAIDCLLALFAVRQRLQGEEFLAFYGAAELPYDASFFSVLREALRLSLKEGRRFSLPARPLPEISELSCAEIAQLACISLLQGRAEALQELLSFAESYWTLREVWQLVSDIACFCEYTGLAPSETFLQFALRLTKDCLQDPAGPRSHRARLEALLKTTVRGSKESAAFRQLMTELCAKFCEVLTERRPTVTDFAHLLRWLPLPAELAAEVLRAVLEAWSSVVALQSESDLSCLCDAVLAAVKGAVTEPEGRRLVVRLLRSLLPDIEAALRAADRAYGCHFLMFLWRDSAAALSQQELPDAAAVTEAVEASLATQLHYGEAFCELDHFPCPCFALLQGAAALLQALPPSAAAADFCVRLCRLFDQRSVDAAFVDAVLLLALRCPAPKDLWTAAAEFCAASESVRLPERSVQLLAEHFLQLPDGEAVLHPLAAVLRATCRPEDALSSEQLSAVERKMGRAWGDGPVPGGRALCEVCGENVGGLCADVELALRCPLNLDCIGD